MAFKRLQYSFRTHKKYKFLVLNVPRLVSMMGWIGSGEGWVGSKCFGLGRVVFAKTDANPTPISLE